MASRNPSSNPSSLAWLCSTRATRSDSCFMSSRSRVSVPFKLVRITHPRERDAHGHNGNHFSAHASSQSVLPILSRLQERPNLAAGAMPQAARPELLRADPKRWLFTRGKGDADQPVILYLI